ncbi:MAG: hypothetical protein FJ086_13045, partial [Deltaproteobacteria bacterium]|nr:hypothetical protein [Deltaproteobacteria bacterium]
MRPVTRLLLTGTFLLSLTGTFLLSLTGCGPLQRLIKSGDPRTYATAQGLVNQKQYVEAAAELRRLELELAPATTDKNGLTRYGDLVTEVTNRRVDRPLCDAESASRSAWSGAEAVSGLARAAAGFQAVEGLPLDRLHSKIRSRAALTARRAKLEEAVAFLLAGAEKQLELIREDVKAGRTGFALYEWSRFRPA